MASTGLAQLTKEIGGRSKLIRNYLKVLHLLKNFPSHYAYKTHTEAILNHRLAIVMETEDEEEIAKKICNGRLEMLVKQSQGELQLSQILLVNKSWEPLMQMPPPLQWTWPPVLE